MTFSVLIQDQESTVLSLHVLTTKFVSVPVTPPSAPDAYHDDATKGEEVSRMALKRSACPLCSRYIRTCSSKDMRIIF